MARIHVVGLLSLTFAGITLAAPPAAAQPAETFTLQCGTETFTVVKANESAAVYTNGSMNFINAIGAIIGTDAAQPNATLCTIDGFGPIPFIITPIH